MAKLRQPPSEIRHSVRQDGISIARSILLLSLTGVLARASSLMLFPSLGSIPSMAAHEPLLLQIVVFATSLTYSGARASTLTIIAAGLISQISRVLPLVLYESELLPVYSPKDLLLPALLALAGGQVFGRSSIPRKALSVAPGFSAIWVTAAPLLQLYVTPIARAIGPDFAARVVMIATITPVMLELYHDALYHRGLSMGGKSWVDVNLVAAAVFGTTPLFADRIAGIWLPSALNAHPYISRIGFLLATVLSFALVRRPQGVILVTSALLMLHSLFLNPHSSTSTAVASQTRALSSHGFSLIDRRESLTGYISVLENRKDGFRVLRCDHSLLGGQWVYGLGDWPGGKGFEGEKALVPEPIYSVFVLLEAVRLLNEPVAPRGAVGHAEALAESEARPVRTLLHDPSATPLQSGNETAALVIGLGVGTAPSALAAHGVNTVVVEIDPTVVEFARRYFDLHPRVNVVVTDALSYIPRLLKLPKFQYIIHDVFTGGAEPAALFTKEFLAMLADVLAPDGIIAINYASDLRLPSAGLVFRTVSSVFPSCRLFREEAPPAPGSENSESEFANMVLFCRKTAGQFKFREPEKLDFLRSGMREEALKPEWEIGLEPFLEAPGILTEGDTHSLEQWARKGAEGHWWVMRSVLPDQVWEMW